MRVIHDSTATVYPFCKNGCLSITIMRRRFGSYNEDKMCKNKIRHLSLKSVKEERIRMQQQYKEEFSSYKCTYCDCYHVGHKTNFEQ